MLNFTFDEIFKILIFVKLNKRRYFYIFAKIVKM